MATKAVSAKGTVVAVQISSEWQVIHEVKSVPEIGRTAATIDVTSLESECKEYIPDIPDFGGGELEFTANAQPSDGSTSNYDILMGIEPDQSLTWRVQYTNVGVEVTFPACCAVRMGGGEVSASQDIMFTLIPQGEPTFADLTSLATLSYVTGDTDTGATA